jgi:hypothetical protein
MILEFTWMEIGWGTMRFVLRMAKKILISKLYIIHEFRKLYILDVNQKRKEMIFGSSED